MIWQLATAFALIFGIDRFMSEGRALTNIIGNNVATFVIAKWENEIDMDTAKKLIGNCSKKIVSPTDNLLR